MLSLCPVYPPKTQQCSWPDDVAPLVNEFNIPKKDLQHTRRGDVMLFKQGLVSVVTRLQRSTERSCLHRDTETLQSDSTSVTNLSVWVFP